jgi:hypothetical protein
MKKYLFIILALLTTSVFAQRTTPSVTSTEKEFLLTVNANTPSFIIYVDNAPIKGNKIKLPRGTYTVIVKAEGFIDWKERINLNENTYLAANLKPAKAFVNIFISPNIINTNEKGAVNLINIYDNGKLLRGYTYEMEPGYHRIRIESGGFAVEQDFMFKAGETYTIEPALSIVID